MHGETRDFLGMKRTYGYVEITEDEAQRSPSTLLRAESLSTGRWTLHEAITIPHFHYSMGTIKTSVHIIIGLQDAMRHRMTEMWGERR